MQEPSSDYGRLRSIAEFYDAVLSRWLIRDIPFYVRMARRARGRVLDVACGTGRVLVPIARAGVEVTGLDLSKWMLAVCRQKLSRDPGAVRHRVHLVRADMRSFRLRRRFRLATIAYRSFELLPTVEDQLACVSCIRRHLFAGGKLVFDLWQPNLSYLTEKKYLAELREKSEIRMPDGRRVLVGRRIARRDLARQVVVQEIIHYVRHANGRRERLVHRLRLRYLFRYEAEHLLARAGFRVEAVYSDYDRAPLGSRYTGRMIFVATKK